MKGDTERQHRHFHGKSGKRKLQNNKNNKENNKRTEAPTTSPTKSIQSLSSKDFDRQLSLLLSFYTPEQPQIVNHKIVLLNHWFSQNFLCEEDEDIFLVSDLSMESACQDRQDNLFYHPQTIVWDDPTSLTTFETLDGFLNYTTWNVTFPVYHKGDSDIQQDMQKALNSKIYNGKLTLPWTYWRLSVPGEEINFFWSLMESSIIPESRPTAPPQQTPNNSANFKSFDGAPTYLQGVGLFTFIIHTLILFLLHFYSKCYMRQKEYKKKERDTARWIGRQGLDDVLLLQSDSLSSTSRSSQESSHGESHYFS